MGYRQRGGGAEMIEELCFQQEQTRALQHYSHTHTHTRSHFVKIKVTTAERNTENGSHTNLPTSLTKISGMSQPYMCKASETSVTLHAGWPQSLLTGYSGSLLVIGHNAMEALSV